MSSCGHWWHVTAVVSKRTPEAVRIALRAGANEVLFMLVDPVDLALAVDGKRNQPRRRPSE
jgi:hypothetical protein